MSSINSVKNYEYFTLVKKNKEIKKLKKRRKNVSWNHHLWILLSELEIIKRYACFIVDNFILSRWF